MTKRNSPLESSNQIIQFIIWFALILHRNVFFYPQKDNYFAICKQSKPLEFKSLSSKNLQISINKSQCNETTTLQASYSVALRGAREIAENLIMFASTDMAHSYSSSKCRSTICSFVSFPKNWRNMRPRFFARINHFIEKYM